MSRRLLVAALGLLCAAPALAEAPAGVETEVLRLHVRPRTAEQIAAFYTARGFPQAMVERLRERCFLTVTVRNKSDDVLWLDLKQWSFTANGKAVRPLDRNHWRELWARMKAPRPAQATFRWTLLPDRLDLRPAEAEGGNVILPRVEAPLRLTARFERGAKRDGRPVRVELEGLHCAGREGAR